MFASQINASAGKARARMTRNDGEIARLYSRIAELERDNSRAMDEFVEARFVLEQLESLKDSRLSAPPPKKTVSIHNIVRNPGEKEADFRWRVYLINNCGTSAACNNNPSGTCSHRFDPDPAVVTAAEAMASLRKME